MHEKLNLMFSGTAQVSHQVRPVFFVNFVCLLVRVTMVDKNKTVVCCLLATMSIMLSEKKKIKRKIWSKGRLSFIHFGRLSALRCCHRGVGR